MIQRLHVTYMTQCDLSCCAIILGDNWAHKKNMIAVNPDYIN